MLYPQIHSTHIAVPPQAILTLVKIELAKVTLRSSQQKDILDRLPQSYGEPLFQPPTPAPVVQQNAAGLPLSDYCAGNLTETDSSRRPKLSNPVKIRQRKLADDGVPRRHKSLGLDGCIGVSLGFQLDPEYVLGDSQRFAVSR